jgi:hypothetical protein
MSLCGVVVNTCNLSTWEARAIGLHFLSQSELSLKKKKSLQAQSMNTYTASSDEVSGLYFQAMLICKNIHIFNIG